MIWVDFIRSTSQTKVGYFKTLVRHNAPHTVDQIKSTHSFVLRAIAIESHAQSPVKTVTHLIFINAAIMPMSDRLTILSVVYAEYAYTLQVDEKSDIYSFGVVLLEILTGRRSVDSEFGDAINIVDWVRSKIQTKEGIAEVLDQNVGASCGSVQEEMMLVLRVALLCTTRCPADRPSMRDVVSMLSEAKPRRKTLLNLHCLQQQQQQLLRSDPPSQATSPTASKTMA